MSNELHARAISVVDAALVGYADEDKPGALLSVVGEMMVEAIRQGLWPGDLAEGLRALANRFDEREDEEDTTDVNASPLETREQRDLLRDWAEMEMRALASWSTLPLRRGRIDPIVLYAGTTAESPPEQSTPDGNLIFTTTFRYHNFPYEKSQETPSDEQVSVIVLDAAPKPTDDE